MKLAADKISQQLLGLPLDPTSLVPQEELQRALLLEAKRQYQPKTTNTAAERAPKVVSVAK